MLRHDHRRAFVHMWAALLVLVFIAILGLALDHGYGYLIGHQLQNASDSSALAGALKVRHSPSQVRATAVAFAAYNEAAKVDVEIFPDDGDVEIGTWDSSTRTFSVGGYSPNAVRVLARRNSDVADGPIDLNFGDIFGTPTVGITRTSIAVLEAGGGSPALLILHPTEPKALELTGGSTLTVIGGPIHVNSNNTSQGAVRLGGNNTLVAPALNVGGSVFDAGGATIDTLINTGAPYMDDPLLGLAAPGETGAPVGIPPAQAMPASSEASATLSPGLYTETLDVGPGKTRTLSPGIYYFDVAGANSVALKLNGGTLTGNGVMIYLNRGGVDISGSATTIQLYGPDASIHSFTGADYYEGITMFQARSNTELAKVALSGTMEFSGTFYFPQNRIQITANGGQVTARIIASMMTFAGQGSIGITFPGYNDEDLSVYLVK
jgi:hypothetical protein